MGKVFCAILNYGKRNSSIALFNRCKKWWDTAIFDSYSKEHNFDEGSILPTDGVNVFFYDNIFCGGLTIEAFNYVKKHNYDYILIITSDVQIDDQNFAELVNSMDFLPYSKIGIYEVSATDYSSVMGNVGPIPYTRNYFKLDNGPRFKDNGRAEGWLYAISTVLTNEISTILDVKKNKYGWGIGSTLIKLSEKHGLANVIDNNVVVWHPKGTGYETAPALEEWHQFDKLSEKIGVQFDFVTVGYATREHNEKFMYYLTDIFGNRNKFIEKICNEDTKLTLTEAYNQIIKESPYETIILLHDDIEFKDLDKWEFIHSEIIQKLFLDNKDCGILGIAPRGILEPDIIKRNYHPEYFFTERLDENNFFYYFNGDIPKFSMELSKDAIVDGMFTAIRRDRIKHLYDENIKVFHCYDVDFCLSNYLSGVGVYITKAFHVCHKSTPKEGYEAYEKEKEYIHKKYDGILPIILEKS